MDRSDILALAKSDFNAQIVGIDLERIREIAWPSEKNSGMTIDLTWCDSSNVGGALAFLVAMGTQNFRFWSLNEDGSLDRYKRGSNTGARALWAAFEENWDGSAISFKERLKDGMTGIKWMFGDIPDPNKRLEILESVFRGNALSACCSELSKDIIETGRVTVGHANSLAQTFPLGFSDPYLKKAMLALSMYAGYLRGIGTSIDSSDVVAFADYQVPRVLRSLQILQYSNALGNKIDGGIPINEDSVEEKAIRAATILACEHIANAAGATSADVDNWLWQAQDVAGKSKFHLTMTTRY